MYSSPFILGLYIGKTLSEGTLMSSSLVKVRRENRSTSHIKVLLVFPSNKFKTFLKITFYPITMQSSFSVVTSVAEKALPKYWCISPVTVVGVALTVPVESR